MDLKRYLTAAGAIFVLVALAHLVRAVMDWPIVIAGWIVLAGLCDRGRAGLSRG